MTENIQYFRKTEAGKHAYASDCWEVVQFWISDYKERLASLEPDRALTTHKVKIDLNGELGLHIYKKKWRCFCQDGDYWVRDMEL